MAVPQRRTSKTRRDKRRTHFKLAVPGMVKCEQCGELKLSSPRMQSLRNLQNKRDHQTIVSNQVVLHPAVRCYFF